MPELWQTSHRYDSSWPSVVLAFFLRYPSPISPHIVSVDTVSRRVDVETCRIYTERLILKKGAASALPKWFPKGVLGKTESWVYERSCVDPISRECEVLTRNLDHRRVMDVWEDLDITLAHPDAEPDGGKAQLPAASQERHLHDNHTDFNTSCVVTSNFGFSYIQSRIEQFGLARYKSGTEKSRSAISVLLELLLQPHHRKSLLNGHPPPLSAMLAPALTDSITRWEETGSGFAGHGFDDTSRDRYLLHLDENEDVNIPAPVPIGEWIRSKRAQVVANTSERLKQVRMRWFGWRLRMKEIEREEVVQVQQEQRNQHNAEQRASESPSASPPASSSSAASSSSSSSSSGSITGQPTNGSGSGSELEPATQAPSPQKRRLKRWVWEWSRNK